MSSEPLSIWRAMRSPWGEMRAILQVGELVSYGANQLSAAIHPNQLPIGAPTAAQNQQPVSDAEASMCQVLMSLATPLATLSWRVAQGSTGGMKVGPSTGRPERTKEIPGVDRV